MVAVLCTSRKRSNGHTGALWRVALETNAREAFGPPRLRGIQMSAVGLSRAYIKRLPSGDTRSARTVS